jgi:hypothetical protein
MINELPIVLTPKQLQEFLGLDKGELNLALREGRIVGAYRAGKRWYVARDRFLRAATQTYGKSKPVMR